MQIEVCCLCKQKAQIQELGKTFLVDCPHCGAYEIEALLVTLDLNDPDKLMVYLDDERKGGKVRPLIFRELLQK